jgi:hypothetical protein
MNHNGFHFHPLGKNNHINTNISAPEEIVLNFSSTPSCTRGCYGECLQHSSYVSLFFIANDGHTSNKKS